MFQASWSSCNGILQWCFWSQNIFVGKIKLYSRTLNYRDQVHVVLFQKQKVFSTANMDAEFSGHLHLFSHLGYFYLIKITDANFLSNTNDSFQSRYCQIHSTFAKFRFCQNIGKFPIGFRSIWRKWVPDSKC